MNLKTKHILAVSAVAGIAGVIGYFIGHKVGFEKGYIFGTPEVEEIESIEIDEDKYEYFETENGYGVRTKQLDPVWTPSPIDIGRPSGRTTEKLTWDQVQEEQFRTYITEYSGKDLDDEDIENLRTQGEVEYTSEEPYLVEEDDVFTVEADPSSVETLTYYKADNVLADSFDEIVTERETIVGDLDIGSINEDVIYIRSPRTKRDYEIIISQGSFERDILGADEDQYLNAVKYFNLGEE